MHALNTASSLDGSYPTKRSIDAYFDGNICRCTGYKPIMQAFQTFSAEASQPTHTSCAGVCASPNKCPKLSQSPGCEPSCCASTDIEELSGKSGCCGGGEGKGKVALMSLKERKHQQLLLSYTPRPLLFVNQATNTRWVRPVGLKQLCAVLEEFSDENLQLVGGNTSIGVTKYLNESGPYNTADAYNVYVDVNMVPEMIAKSFDATTRTVSVGAATPINELVAYLQKHSLQYSQNPAGSFSTEVNHHSLFSVTAHHLAKVANTQVRNAGSWAGNLMVFLRYNQFPSDVLIALTTANARLVLCNTDAELTTVDMATFIGFDFQQFSAQGYFILSLSITEPRLRGGSLVVAETFKIAQRLVNAHAHVNCGFQFSVTNESRPSFSRSVVPVCTYARVVIGGVSKKTFIATRTESVLTNAPVSAATLSSALAALDVDLAAVGDSEQSLSSQLFRKSVMQSCLYRALLRCYPVTELPQNLLTAVQPWQIPVSRRFTFVYFQDMQ